MHTVACCLSSHSSSLEAAANLALQCVPLRSAGEAIDNKGNKLNSTKAFAVGGDGKVRHILQRMGGAMYKLRLQDMNRCVCLHLVCVCVC